MSKTFKDFAEACWDSHKQVGTKISSRTGKRVPNCVPKNEDTLDEKKVKITKNGKELLVWDAELRTYQQMGWTLVESTKSEYYRPDDMHRTRLMPHIVVDKSNKVVYRGTRNNAFIYQEKEYSNNAHLKIYLDKKARVGDTFKFKFGQYPISNPRLKGTAAMNKPATHNLSSSVDEVSSAMRALRRRNAKNARTQKTIAKYGQAAKMGIPASQVNQRRSAVTRKKI